MDGCSLYTGRGKEEQEKLGNAEHREFVEVKVGRRRTIGHGPRKD